MKKISLFQIAAKKYTSFSSELRDVKKEFFTEQLITTTPATAAQAVPPGQNPGGEVAPGAPKGGLAPGQKSEQPTTQGTQGQPSGGIDLMDPTTKVVVSADGKQTFAINEKVPGQAMLLTPEQVTAYNSVKKLSPQVEAVLADKTEHTTGDILGPLSELSRGSEGLKETENMEEDDSDITEVSHVDDTLVKEDEGDTEDGTPGQEGADEGTAEPATSNSPVMGHPQTPGMDAVGDPAAGLSSRSKVEPSGSGTGQPKNASSNMPLEKDNEMSAEKSAGETTGIDGSYQAEAGKEGEEVKKDTSQTSDTTGKPFAKGAGDAEEVNSSVLGPGLQNDTVPGLKDASIDKQAEAGNEAITDPNAKTDAFWVPGDEDGFGGLKDVVSTVAQKAGVPDGQTNIVKDPATGALVKKPTMPAHAIPNMRQYVKTNGVPGAPSVLGAGMGHNPVDISDLDGVMGMDTSNDRALNISLNFNF